MKRSSTLFLKATVVVMGAAVLALCIFALPAMWMAVSAEFPTIAYALYTVLTVMYLAAIPYFIGLYQTLRLLRSIDSNNAFSQSSVTALRSIKYCAAIISGLYVLALPFMYIWADADDAPGLVVIGMVLACAPLAVAVFAAVLQRLLHQAITIQAENELTV